MGELRAVTAAAPKDLAEWRAALFAATPLIVSEYSPASAALALDWFEEIRDEANPPQPYVPTPRLTVTDDDVAALVASTTAPIHEVLTTGLLLAEVDQIMNNAARVLEAEIQKQVASGFWDTITKNADADPAARGWYRIARGGACKFCVMVAGRGDVYTRTSVTFAAHRACHCVAAPSYDPNAPTADVMQYRASSSSTRTPGQRAALRDYLNQNFPDAPG